MDNNKTALGIEQNLEAVLCYAGAFITGIIFLFVEKENKYVRFHAMQSLVTFLGLYIISMVIAIVPIIGAIISILITPLGIILWIFMMYKAYQGEMYKLPFAGDFSEEQIFGNNTDTATGGKEKPETENFELDNSNDLDDNEDGEEKTDI